MSINDWKNGNEDLPRTIDEAQRRGYELIPDLHRFLEEQLQTQGHNAAASRHQFSVQIDAVNCANLPRDTPCYYQCLPTGVLIIGLCDGIDCHRFKAKEPCHYTGP